MEFAGNIIGGAFSMLTNKMNNDNAERREGKARWENYKYGEMQAENADKRTRELYADLMSPAAMRKQYQEAGLSPSLMFSNGGGAGGSVPNGAQGSSASVQPNVFGLNAMDAAQIGLALAQTKNTEAQTEKTKAETENVNKDTDIKELERQTREMNVQLESVDFNILQHFIINDDGTYNSLSNLAENSWDFEDFKRQIGRIADKEGAQNPYLKSAIYTEQGERTLRLIYTANNKLRSEIATLSETEINARFQISIVKALEEMDFAKLSAKETIQQLKTSISTEELNERQKDAWNRLLQRLENRNSTASDIAICLGLILNNALSNYHYNIGSRNTHSIVEHTKK